MPYPERLFRFIRTEKHVNKWNGVLRDAFEPPKRQKLRDDGQIEISIDWEDDDDVLAGTRARNNNPPAVAALSRPVIDILLERADGFPPGVLSYEREPIKGNPHHGNLLLSSNAPLQERMRTISLLATLARIVP